MASSKEARGIPGTKLLAWVIVAGVCAFQAWAYAFRLDLSLGPRVILEPWLLHRGFTIYSSLLDIHTPLMPFTLALVHGIAPSELRAAQITQVSLVTLTTLLVALVTWSMTRSLIADHQSQKVTFQPGTAWMVAAAAAVFFVLFSPGFSYGKLWHEFFLAPLFLLLVLAQSGLSHPAHRRRLAAAGLIGGLAILAKQPAALPYGMLLFFNGFDAWKQTRSWKPVLQEILIPGVISVLVFGVFLSYQLAAAGTLQGFIYQAVIYPLSSSYQNGSEQAPTLAQLQFALSAVLLVPAGFAAVPFSKRTGKQELWSRLCAAVILLAGSLILAYPRFAFFHLQPALPLAAILSAVGTASAFQVIRPGRGFFTGVVIALAAWWLLVAGAGYLPALQDGPHRKIAEYSPLLSLADDIRSYTGSEPPSIFLFLEDESSSNLYYLLGSTPDGFRVFHYPWYMVEEKIRDQLYAGLVEAQPEWVLEFPDIWNVKPMVPEITAFIENNYEEAAVLTGGQVLYHRK